MPGEWTLNIDLVRVPTKVMFMFGLLNPSRSQGWRHVCPVRNYVYKNLVSLIGQFFDDGQQASVQREALEAFLSLAGATFDLETFLSRANFNSSDPLAISTLATSIPWDLLPFDGGCLGQKLDLGLRIPAPLRVRARTVEGTGSRPQFLHVIANPRLDLSPDEEAAAIRKLVEEHGELDYELFVDPTPDQLVLFLGKCKRATPYFHFTGHVDPGRGLVLKDGTLECEELTQYFPGSSDQIVMLNGCDALWNGVPSDGDGSIAELDNDEKPPIGDPGGADMFQTAAVAGAFLDAGAGAVIAPRSQIVDRDAGHAAKLVWERVFAGEALGSVVRKMGLGLADANCAIQSRYTYVLYGAPSARVRQRSAINTAVKAVTDSWLSQPIVLEACGDAGGTAEPRHLFGALTRRWIIGQAYFERQGHRYIETLESLRRILRVSVSPLPADKVELSAAGRRMLELAADRFPNTTPELALLEALVMVNDLEVQCALEALERWPRSVDVLLDLARVWNAAGRQIPQAAFDPDGYANFSVLLPELHVPRSSARTVSATKVDIWDFFVVLLGSGGNTAKAWQSWNSARASLPPAPGGAWRTGNRLHWNSLTDGLQQVMMDAFNMSQHEGGSTVTESQFVSCLMDSNNFEWGDLPVAARHWLNSSGIEEGKWSEFLRWLSLDSLSWL